MSRAGRVCRRWTPDEVARFKEMRAAGRTHAECAYVLGRSVSAVEQAAGPLGMRTRACIPWTRADYRIVVRMVMDGETSREIGAATGRSRSAVAKIVTQIRKRLRQAGVKFTPPQIGGRRPQVHA
jgi:DNA-binding CsgD family transcriptional regulator